MLFSTVLMISDTTSKHMRHHQQFKMATDKDLKAKAKMAIYIRPKLLH